MKVKQPKRNPESIEVVGSKRSYVAPHLEALGHMAVVTQKSVTATDGQNQQSRAKQ